MSHLWPYSTPQQFKITPRSTVLDGLELNDNEILQTVPLQFSNIIITLTPGRVLIYNLKPYALIAAHERTSESINEFGKNISIKASLVLDKPISGLVTKREIDYLSLTPGKLIFYVVTEKNFLFTYQILKNSTSISVFKEYGIPVIDVLLANEGEDQTYETDEDDDTLTVFQKNKSSNMIQNGYAVTKEKRFFRFLSGNPEIHNELPIKKVELRLKVVLKFDYKIIDMLCFKKFSEVGDGQHEDHLAVLVPNGLQFLKLVNFKLIKSRSLELHDCFKVCPGIDSLLILANVEAEREITMFTLNCLEFSVKDFTIDYDKRVSECFQIGNNLVFVSEKRVMYFNLIKLKIEYHFDVQFTIKICKYLDQSLLLFVSTDNLLFIYSEGGNLLFSTDYDNEDVNSYPLFDYVDLLRIDTTLVSVAKTGDIQLWEFWRGFKQAFGDLRNSKTYILNNGNNIMLYSPLRDSPLNFDHLSIIKLPSKSLNNYIPITRVNGNLKLLAVYISNKKLLLLQNLETNIWFSFPDLIIVDFYWLGNSYLVCDVKNDDDTRSLICARIPLQETNLEDFSEFIIWEYNVPNGTTIKSIHVNTLYKYKPLKVKSKEATLSVQSIEKFFKTGEVILVTDSEIITFDVISVVHVSGVNIVKRFYQFQKVPILEDISNLIIDWVINIKDGLMVYANRTIYKVDRLNEENWRILELLHGIESVVDVLKDEIYLIKDKQYLTYKIEELWEDKKESLTIPIKDETYPLLTSPESATLHSLQCIFNKNFTKLAAKNEIYLDKLILTKIELGVDLEEITAEFNSIKHYKFALEKILSEKILEGENLDEILQLVKLCHSNKDASPRNTHKDLLEIISNCLRKIEIKYWSKLFTSLGKTPRDLLAMCLEGNEAKILGILLLVFLNYNEDALVGELNEEEEDNMGKLQSPTASINVSKILKDEELMLRVLKVLVNSAARETDEVRAYDAWDMCFQLIRLLRALEAESNINLVQKAIEML